MGLKYLTIIRNESPLPKHHGVFLIRVTLINDILLSYSACTLEELNKPQKSEWTPNDIKTSNCCVCVCVCVCV